MGDEALAEDFGDLPGDVAAGHVHLPEAVLGGDVALGGEEIVEVGGLDVRDAVLVAADGDFGGKAGSWTEPSIWGREARMACLSQNAPPPTAAAASRMRTRRAMRRGAARDACLRSETITSSPEWEFKCPLSHWEWRYDAAGYTTFKLGNCRMSASSGRGKWRFE